MRSRVYADLEARIESVKEGWTQGLQCRMYPNWVHAVISWCRELLKMGDA